MPTNRTRIKRGVRSRVSDEARAVYNEALKLQDIHRDHIRAMCPTVGKHCDECTKYVDLRRELGRMVGVPFFEGSPLDSEDPPDYMLHNPLQSGYWRKAWALRCELERSAG